MTLIQHRPFTRLLARTHSALLLIALVSSGCSLSAKFLGKSPSASSQPQPSSPSARPAAPQGLAAAASSDAPSALRPASAKLVGFLDHGATSYQNGRLYFDAYLAGLPTSSAPPSVELRRGGKVLGAVPMLPDRDWDAVFVCPGTVASTSISSSTVRYQDDCSIAADLPAGTYQLAIVVDGRAVAEQAIEIARSHRAGGQPYLIVAPSARAGAGRLSYASATFWHQVDLRDQVELLHFVWLQGDRVVGRDHALARGHELWHDDSPLVDVVPVRGPKPTVSWGASAKDLRLVVFAGAKQPVSTLRLEVVHTTGDIGKVGALVPADDLTAEQLRIASEVAAELGGRGGHGVQGIDIEWPEAVVCAVTRSADARNALREWVQSAAGVGFSMHDAKRAEQRSQQAWRSRAERRKHAASAQNSRQGARAGQRRAREADAALRRLARAHKPGCLTALAPVRAE